MSGGGDFQLGTLCFFPEFIIHHGNGLLIGIIAETIGVEPNLVDIDIKILRCAFGKRKRQIGIGAATVPKLQIQLHFHQSLKQRGIVAHVDIVAALHPERGDVTKQFHPLAAVVADSHSARTVVSVAIAIDAVVLEIRHDVVECSDMGWKHILTLFAMLGRSTHQIAVHGGHFQCILYLVLDFKLVGHHGSLASRLGDTDCHGIVAESRRRPITKIIAVLWIVRIIGI